LWVDDLYVKLVAHSTVSGQCKKAMT